MKVTVKASFYDNIESVDRTRDDMFECSQERFDEINSAGFGQLVEKVPTQRRSQKKQAEEEE